MRSVLHQKLRIFPFSSNEYVGRPTPKSVLYRINQVLIKPLFSHLKARCSHLPFKKVRFLEVTNLGLRPRDLAKPTLTVGKRDVPGPVFSYKLRYIVGFWLVEMAISTNPKPTIYRNLYENTDLILDIPYSPTTSSLVPTSLFQKLCFLRCVAWVFFLLKSSS